MNTVINPAGICTMKQWWGLCGPEGYAGSSVATSRASHAREVKGDDPDKEGHPGPSSWGLGVALTTPTHKIYLLRNFNQSLGMGIKRL